MGSMLMKQEKNGKTLELENFEYQKSQTQICDDHLEENSEEV